LVLLRHFPGNGLENLCSRNRKYLGFFTGTRPWYRDNARPVDDPTKIRLDIFEGPLDLLLYLIKKEEIDIYDIPIVKITRQYLDYINTFRMLNIELASEFIVMAATLMYIKSRMLLPRQVQPPEEEAEEDDPRWDLIRQLIEYKKFKDAAGFLAMREGEQSRWFAVHSEPVAPPVPEETPEIEVSIFDLIRAFRKVLNRFAEDNSLGVIHAERFSVGEKIDHLLAVIEPGQTVPFTSLFDDARSRAEVIATFLALLELMKMNQFAVTQHDPLGEIEVTRKAIV